MYSTNIEDNRYLVKCLMVSRYIVSDDFIVDTGAKYTCCSYSVIDVELRENDMKGCKTRLVGGLVRGSVVKFYKYSLRQFTIGNIDMKEQDIWITFDERVTDIILGMDILKQVMVITNPINQKIYFCKDADDYYKNFDLLSEMQECMKFRDKKP